MIFSFSHIISWTSICILFRRLFLHVQLSWELIILFPSFCRERRHMSSASSLHSLCAGSHDTGRERLGMLFLAARIKHATVEEMFGAVFAIRSVSYQTISMLWMQSRRLDLPRSSCNKSSLRDFRTCPVYLLYLGLIGSALRGKKNRWQWLTWY
jgi:hypothetical protein